MYSNQPTGNVALNRNKFRGGKEQRVQGFTLINLLITVAILATLTAAGASSFTNAIQNNRLSGLRADLENSIQLALSAAMTTGERVVLCASSDLTSCSGVNQWESGWIVVANPKGTPEVINVVEREVGVTVRASGLNQLDQIVFTEEGTLDDTAAPGTFTFCDARGPTQARAVILSSAGLARPGVDGDDNNVVENDNGVDISC